MPRLTRWLVRAAMLYLVAALALGILMQAPFATQLPVMRAIWPAYLHLLVVGWLTQLIFGVAYWMFPRYSAEKPRGNEPLGWAALVLLNGGLILRAVAEPWYSITGSGGVALVLSATLQMLAGFAFVANTWPRVRER